MRNSTKAVSAIVVLLIPFVTVNGATASQIRQCQPTDVHVSASTSKPSYAAGTPVKLIATIANVSRTACTITIGGTSPSMRITNSKGAVVWDNCYSNDQPGACALYLILRTLNPVSRYSTTRIWKQHIAGKIAPRGTYRLRVNYSGIDSNAIFKFSIA